MTTINNILAWLKQNILLTIGILFVLLLVFFPRVLKKLFGGTRRVKHRRPVAVSYRRKRRSLPRSVGMHKASPSTYNKNGTRKKPWQVKGSPAARRHMAQIRARR